MVVDLHHCPLGRTQALVAGATNARRILAIDYGRRRLGLALSDELGVTAQPLGTISRVNRQIDLRRIRRVCRDNSVSRIIVGYPLRMSGEPGEMATEVARFRARLRKETGIETELVDERLTSWEAEQTLAEGRSPRRRNRGAIDDVAAAIFLRDYLERKSHHADTSKTEND